MMRSPIMVVLQALLFALAGPTADARTWIVAPDGTGDFTGIQDAIDAASSGDEIRILPSTYFETLNLHGKALDLIGEQGAAATVVDAGAGGSVLQIPFTPGGAPHLRGLTFTNGTGTILNRPQTEGRFGGGIFVEVAAPLIEDCVISGNTANQGGGVFVISGIPRFRNCTISWNSAGRGGAFSAELDGGVHLENCRIEDNAGVFGGGLDLFRSRAWVDGCRLSGNSAYQGGAIRLLETGETAVRIEGCLITGNAADLGAAIHSYQGLFDLASTTIADNPSGPTGASLNLDASSATVRSTIVAFGDPGETVLCAQSDPIFQCVVLWPPSRLEIPPCADGDQVLLSDPLFCDRAQGDYSLRVDSPCLPGQGIPGCGLIGALELGCQGPVPAQPLTWGGLKALYR